SSVGASDTYCCLTRVPSARMSLNRTALEASVAEKSFTGIETSPKLSDNEAMARGIVDIQSGIDSWHLQGAIYLSNGTPATNLLDTEIPTRAGGELGAVASGHVRASDN